MFTNCKNGQPPLNVNIKSADSDADMSGMVKFIAPPKTLDKFVQSPIIILPLPKLIARIGRKRSSIYSMMDRTHKNHDPSFPTQINTGRRSIGWIESEVNQWLELRISASRGGISN